MSSIQKAVSLSSDVQTTREGGIGYQLTFKEKLAEFFSLGLLNGNFYQSQDEVLKGAKELFERALKEEPYFATQCAIYGNKENSLKLVPTVWLVYLSTLEDKSLYKSAFPQIIRNPKMLHDFVEISRKSAIRQGLGSSVKKTINLWLKNSLNEYQASRNKGKLSDVIKLTRPSDQDESFQRFMKYIAKDELSFPRIVALKGVIDDLNNGVLSETTLLEIETHRLQLEELKHSTANLTQEQKKALYTQMYKGLNYASLILNLVALERVFATEVMKQQNVLMKDGKYHTFTQMVVLETVIPTELIEVVSTRISDIDAYRRSNMLPFALFNAEKMVVTPEFKQALARLFKIASEQAFSIDPNVSLMVGVDTSASMNSFVNETGTIRARDVATLFGAMTKKAHAKTNVFAVATDMVHIPLKAQEDVFKMASSIAETYVGYGTYFEQIMKHYNGEKYLLLITDSEQADNLESKWKKARKPDGAKLIVWQLQAYQTQLSKDPSVVYLRGYSDRLLGLVKAIIEGKTGQMEEIQKIIV